MKKLLTLLLFLSIFSTSSMERQPEEDNSPKALKKRSLSESGEKNCHVSRLIALSEWGGIKQGVNKLQYKIAPIPRSFFREGC